MSATLVPIIALAIYGPAARKEGVIVATAKTFKQEVIEHDGPVAVQLFAPWCGHCKALKPAWKAATKALQGKVKLVVVDATAEQQLAQKYGVRGYPTILIFGDNKRKPQPYEGGRDERSLISGLKKAAAAGGASGGGSAKASAGGASGGGGSAKPKPSPPSGPKPSPSSSRSEAHPPSGGVGTFGGKGVIQLTDQTFASEVLRSDALWLVVFYAPWCGHCKRLEPDFGAAARRLDGQARLAAVDATQNSEVSKIYDVNGYPSLKAFYKGKLTDQAGYDGPRDVEGMVGWALQTLEALGVEAEVPQLLDASQFKRSCVSKKGALCAVAFLPHILDSGAAGREAYLDTLKAVAKKHRQLWTFLWSEVGEQEALEASLGGLAGVPTLAAISGDKGRFALMRDAFDAKHAAAFVGGVLRGSTKTQPASFGAIATVDEWDGKDGELPEEEPLDAYDDVELDA